MAGSTVLVVVVPQFHHSNPVIGNFYKAIACFVTLEEAVKGPFKNAGSKVTIVT